MKTIFSILFIHLTFICLGQEIVNCSYKIITKRVKPDTVLLNIEYYDYAGKLISEINNRNETTIYYYNNDKLKKVVFLLNKDTTSVANYDFSNNQKKVVTNYFLPYKSKLTYIVSYLDSQYKTILNEKVWDHYEEDSVYIWTHFYNYNIDGKLACSYYEDCLNDSITFNNYQDKNHKLVTIENHFRGGDLYYEETKIEDSNQILIKTKYLLTGSETLTVKYIDEDHLNYKTEYYGTINTSCIENDPKRYTQSKPITNTADEIIAREKFYCR